MEVKLDGTTSFPLPQKGDKFITKKATATSIIEIAPLSDVSQSFFTYANYFFQTAHLITENVLTAAVPSISNLDTIFFSIAFLYRHSIELALKAIGFKYITSDIDQQNFIDQTYHNLSEILIWIELFIRPWKIDDEFDWLINYLNSLSEIDKESDSFRYPFHIIRTRDSIDNSIEFTIKRVFEKQTHIDLVKFANKFEAAFEIITNWYNEKSSPSIEWLGLEPVFIEEGGNYYAQSVVGYPYSRDDFYPYIRAYTAAARVLFTNAKDTFGQSDNGSLVARFLPMCYLYRNCIELCLKSIWFECKEVDFQIRCQKMQKKKHSIIGLWHLVEPYIIQYSETPDEMEFVSILADYLQQIHDIDGEACKFRYPISNNLTPQFAQKECFDLIQTQKFLDSTIFAFDCISATLAQMNEWKAEMEGYNS